MTEARIAIVLKGYPRLSETFIAQEILALERRGFALAIWSLRRPTDDARHPMHAAIAAPVAYLPEYLHAAPLRVLRSLVWGLRRPGFPALAAQFAKDFLRDPTASRIRRFGQALVLAKSLPGAIRHLHAHFLHTPASVARYAAILTGRTWSFSAHAKDIWTTPDWELSEKLGDADWGVTCTRDGLERLRTHLGPQQSPAHEPALPPVERASPLPESDGRDRSGSFSSLTPSLIRTGLRIHTTGSAIRDALPPPSAGEGGPRISEGRERGATYPDNALPSPDPHRGPPSPAEGGGDRASFESIARFVDLVDRTGEGAPLRFPRLMGQRGTRPNRSVDPDHIALAYHGLDLARFPEPPANRPNRDGADAGDPITMLCVGRLVAKKGHDDLIDALAALPPDLHWRLDLIGGGELGTALKARVAARGLDGRIAFHGALAQPAVIAAMQAADLFVLPAKPAPSGDRDGLPNVLMEAASQGLPILATAFAGTPEFITDGREGRLVPPGDPATLSAAILRLARDPEERGRLAEAARARLVRDFALDAGLDLIAGRLSASAGIAVAAQPTPARATEACPCGC